jgi:hypothetical protein
MGLTLRSEQRGTGAARSDRELVAAAVIESLAGANHGFQFSSAFYVGALLGRQRTRKSQTKAVQLMWISNEITVLLAKTWQLWARALHMLSDHVTLRNSRRAQLEGSPTFAGAGRAGGVWHVLGVDLTDLGEIISVGVEDRCLDQIGRRRPGRLEDGREVSERLFGLGLDAVTDSTRSGVDSRCSGAEHEAARNDRMGVRAGSRPLTTDFRVMALSS